MEYIRSQAAKMARRQPVSPILTKERGGIDREALRWPSAGLWAGKAPLLGGLRIPGSCDVVAGGQVEILANNLSKTPIMATA